MKKFIGSAVLGGFMLAGAIVPAFSFAAVHDTNPGQQQAIASGAQCGTGAASGAFADVNGNFGFLGQREPKPGANGYQTGLNNSSVCGNR